MSGDRKLWVAARLRGIADMRDGPLNLDGRMLLREAADLLNASVPVAALDPVHALRTDVEKLCETLEQIASGLAEPFMQGGCSKTEAIEIARAAVKRARA